MQNPLLTSDIFWIMNTLFAPCTGRHIFLRYSLGFSACEWSCLRDVKMICQDQCCRCQWKGFTQWLYAMPVSMVRLGVGGCEECFWVIINTRFLNYNSPKPDICPLILTYLDTKHYLIASSVTVSFFFILNVVYEYRSFINCRWIGWRLSKLVPDWLAFWQELIQKWAL